MHTILIVDDEPYNVDYLEQELDDLGYATISAVNGQDALDKIRSQSPDLVLLDIMMPIMDGFSVLKQMKEDAAIRDIPVIIISANNDLESVVKGIKQGAEDYLPKPFEPTLLQARIASSLEKKLMRDERKRLIRTFADKEVAEQLMREGFTLGGRHTVISAMFCDIRNFTTITEAHDPADVIAMINEYYHIVINSVQAHGGNANQMQGDGLMSFFGAPVQYEDHARRAVDCALDVHRQIKEHNAEQAKKNGLQIQIGTGIASGRVVAGFAGTQTRATYICVGDIVNLSARLESHTKVVKKPILIDEATFNMLEGSIPCEALGEEIFKGKTVPVRIYSISA